MLDSARLVANLRARSGWLSSSDASFSRATRRCKTVGGIATVGALKGAWFKDPDGTLLGLVSAG